MIRVCKKYFILLGVISLVFVGFLNSGFAANDWINPIFAIEEKFDDNVFLTNGDESKDSITTVVVGAVFEPKLNRHDFTLSYMLDAQNFKKNTSENTLNHNVDTAVTLNFNDWRVDLNNTFRFFEDRIGTEDTARIPRTANTTDVKLIYAFNKLDASFNYIYSLDDYRSDEAIGDFNGQTLTYQDNDTNEHSGEIELAFKFWPKTALLFSGAYGVLKYDTGKKSDSNYIDILTGLKGQFMKKGSVEGKIGYRSQNYENSTNDFNSIIFQASLKENFTRRDKVIFDFERTTNSTIFQQNEFFSGTLFSFLYEHIFNNRFAGIVKGFYGFNKYPVEITKGTQTDKRKDDLWSAGVELKYQLPRWGAIKLAYNHSQKNSNFDSFDYKNNLFSLGVEITF